MGQRIQEHELQIPALYVIYKNTKANTSQIKSVLTKIFNPQGEDAKILAGRTDTKFSQIVRNLMGSHYTANGMAAYTIKDSRNFFSLTEKGKQIVENNLSYLEYIFDNSFKYEDAIELSAKVYNSKHKKQKIYVYSENEKVFEGRSEVKTTIVKERSQKLRSTAINYYTRNGKITCSVCGFDFEKTYGDLGKKYIQIHHETPIYQYSDEGFEEYLTEAIHKVKPLCSNCHCMIHRHSDKILTIDELKSIIDKNKASQN